VARPIQRSLIALTLLVLVAAVAVAGSGPAAGALCTLPLALVILPLLFDRGEALIDRLARPRRAARRRRLASRALPLSVRLIARILPRGGRLLAFSLAVRPPPRSSLTA